MDTHFGSKVFKNRRFEHDRLDPEVNPDPRSQTTKPTLGLGNGKRDPGSFVVYKLSICCEIVPFPETVKVKLCTSSL